MKQTENKRFLNPRLFYLVIVICGYISLACGGKSTSNAATAASLLPKESGTDGCTISGISNQIKAGYTLASATQSAVNTRLIQDTYYAIVQVKGAQIATNIVFNQDVSPNIYSSTSCPLNLDSDSLAVVGTAYSRTVTGSTTTISFLKSGSYLLYLYSKTNFQTSGLTVIATGTALQTVSDDAVAGLLSGSTTTFVFACNDASASGICQNYFGLFSSCLSGGTKQSSKCSETNVVGSCKLTQASVGTIISVYTSPILATSSAAQAKCTSGTFQSGSTVQTP